MNKIYEEFLKKYLSQKIKETRKQQGLTQEQMAEALDISTRAYVNLEHGKSICKVQTLFHFLSFYQDPENLLKEITQILEEVKENIS